MSQKLLEVITLGHCSHEFSWPRRAPDGDYYQVCLLCATQYKYDWKTMRRGGRVENSLPETNLGSTRGERRPTWVPRARRLKLHAPVRYRAKGQSLWREGVIENISQSGLLFHSEEGLPQNTLVELIFEMPEEISGQKNSAVLCQGRITRSRPRSNGESNTELAASVLDYKFLRPN
jgi:PilZ domain-containing protein